MISLIKKFHSKSIQLLVLFALATFLQTTAFGAGQVDTSFVSSVFVAPQGTVNQTVVQPDGKIIIAGDFNVAGKYARTDITRLNADGTVDLTFNEVPIVANTSGNSYITKLALQSDGKILVGGEFGIAGFGSFGLIRLNPDGSFDADFLNRGGLNSLYHLFDFAISPDDKIIYSGSKSGAGLVIGRLNADGNLVAETANSVYKLALQPDGKIVAYGNNFSIFRLNSDFSADNTFQSSPISYSVLDIVIQADGKILIGGALSAVNNFPINRIARLNADGTIDSSFNIGTDGPNDTVKKIIVLADGKILIGGDFTTFNGAPARRVARLNPANGSLDTSFNSGIDISNLMVNDLDVQPDGKLITASNPLFRLNPDGTIDASFVSPAIGDFGSASITVVQPDNKILVGGYFTMANEKTIRHLARFNADGSIDNTFNQTYLPLSANIFAIAVQPDGKIIAGGDGFGGAARFNSDGTFDRLISTGQIAYDIKIQPDGKILISGLGYVKRFNADATADATFTTAIASAKIYKMAIQPDGKILIVGSFTQINGINRSRIARLNADGTLDASFNPVGGANSDVYDIARQTDGKFLVGGDFTGVNFDTTKKYLARLNPDGSLDTGFTSALATTKIRAVRIEPSGKILVGGLSDVVSASQPPGKIARLNPDGSLDPTFNNSINIDRVVNSIDLQTDNKIILAGFFSRVNGVSNLGVARLLNSAGGAKPFDFDGDGKTDISIFRPSAGEWWYLRSSDGQNRAFQFGSSSDKLTPADFTGDGKTDVAFWRPSTGEWFILRSEDNSYYSF
ncbi:MAG TPA: FG-GAP-like repeat-containing protein, partial [Pyrinomonadaceae bacterium]